MAKQRDNDPVTERDNGNPDVVLHRSGDAMRPNQTPYGFIARNPVIRVVPPGAQITVNLGLQANVPLLAFPVRRAADYVRVNGSDGAVVVQPGEDIVAVVRNDGQFPLTVEDGEGLVSLYPLRFSGSFVVD